MSHSLFISAIAPNSPKSEAVAAFKELIQQSGTSLTVFRPVACHNCACKGITGDNPDSFMDGIISSFKKACSEAEFVLCEGTDFKGSIPAFELNLNFCVAAKIGVPVVIAMSGAGSSADIVTAAIKTCVCQLTEKALSLLGVYLTDMSEEDIKAINTRFPFPVSNKASDFAVILPNCIGHVTPRLFEAGLIEKAQKHPMRIVLPEGEEDRLISAAGILLQRKMAQIILLGREDVIKARAKELGADLSGASFINPVESPDFEDFSATYAQLRAKKGVTIEQAREKMSDSTYFGTMMIYKEQADGMVSGAINTTAHTVRPALEFIKTKPNVSIVSGSFFVCLKDRVNTYSDCAINLYPEAEQIADIAIATAETAKAFGLEQRVAMLSYSTGNSGKGESVDKVKEATRIAKEKAPDLAITGPIQYDAAVDPITAKTKMPGDPVAGKATVFIVPNIDAGNIVYKAIQRSTGAIAIGPILQGLRKPVNDLSRGCTVADIVNTVAITAIQAQAEKGLI